MSITEAINEWIEFYGSERDALNVALARFLYYKELYEQTKKELNDLSTVEDGLGNHWSRWCSECGAEMQVVRPGKVQCPNCE